MSSWIARYPQWFAIEFQALANEYPHFRVDEAALHKGYVRFFGELIIRASDGPKRHAVKLSFPPSSPFSFPVVTPLKSLPTFTSQGGVQAEPEAEFFDRRHQMPSGSLCLFQHQTRAVEGGEIVHAVDVLSRAEKWFLGHYTGHWPPDSQESELESHFSYAGEVLLSNALYADDITGFGKLFAARDVKRIVLDRSGDHPPVIVVGLTKEASVYSQIDARQELENIFPWLTNEFWSPLQLAELESKLGDDGLWGIVVERGFWWALDSEPAPFRDVAGLLKEIEKVAPSGDAWKAVTTLMGKALSTESIHFIGLRYPGRSGGPEWLFVQLIAELPKGPGGATILESESAKKQRILSAQVSGFRSNSARTDDLQLRNKRVVSADVREKTVALIGLGALGSKVAELLGQAGVGRFRLCDYDRMSIGNVARHVGGLQDFGARKVDVVARRLFEINAYVDVQRPLFDSATSSVERLVEFQNGADVVVSTIADEGMESSINQVAVSHQVTMVYGRAMRSGSMGRVFVVRPRKDACKTCLSHYAIDRAAGVPSDWIAVAERDEDVLLHECGRPVIPGSAVDLSFTASLIARKTLELLQGQTLASNHLVWSRDEATDVDPRLSAPFTVIGNSFLPWSGCPTCQIPPVNEIVIPPDVRVVIQAEVEASTTTETGGILIGYVDGRKAVIVKATGPGPKAVRTPTRFERDVEFVQEELNRMTTELGPRGLYIGEWHSHLESDPKPSGRDILSLTEIAESANYATECPVMLIAGLDPKSRKMVTLKGWSFPKMGAMFGVPLKASLEE